MTVHPGAESTERLVPDDDPGERAQGRRRGRQAAGPAAQRSRGQRRALALAVVTALLGGLVGLVVAVSDPAPPTAVTRLSFVQDPTLPGEQSSSSPDATDRFIQTQILILTGADIRDAVSDALGLGDDLTLSAQQVGSTDIVELQVQAGTDDAARDASDAVIAQYDQQRVAAVTAQVDALLAGVEAEIADLETALASDENGALAGATATEYSRLLSSRSQLVLLRSGEQAYTQVVSAPRSMSVGGAGAAVQATLLGLLLGALVGVAMALLLQRVRTE
ncbi:hypothetical protein GCM10027451_43260 [Geodermatophilus aquaeductus]|uniref:Chain length determinant protein n=1 Tax=Geodermatophilus aquaeductus TaxID=1564161 RepID=A0A521FQQ8_9ACTN|nr:hypothetical protein [Geodermatophilus aquaeductus]SMO98522.1 hypothetical protein SAMN06273567_11395 [Geodermatophilus aquaeductus]